VYERILQSPKVDACEFDVVIASSAFALSEILATLKLQRTRTVENPVLIVPSERIALDAQEMGFSNVRTSDGASKSAVLSTLKSLNRH
jgi:uroporphyrinogen-III synthase